MTWVAGEQERFEEFFRLRGLRMQNRGRLELALVAPSSAPYLAVQDNFEALVRDAMQRKQPPEDEYPDSRVVINHNIW